MLTGLIVAAPEPPGQQVRTRENIDRLHSEAAFAALCGASPLPVSTGRATATASTTAATATPTALHAIAVRRLRYGQRTRACAQRRTAEGKTKTEIIRCLTRHSAREIYHALSAGLQPAKRAAPAGPIVAIPYGAGPIGQSVTRT